MLRSSAPLALLLAAALAGCGSGTATPKSTAPAPTSTAAAPTASAPAQATQTAATGSTGRTGTAAKPMDRHEQRAFVEAAFRRRFRERFMEGPKKGFVQQPGQACADNGPGEGGNETYMCEGWGSVPSAGGCILVTTEPATVEGVPSLQAKHLQRGQSPFGAGSCKINGVP